jgi:septal ring factor EnvC (AmiA/AmiB activator)
MPRPLTERQDLEQERDGLLKQLAADWHELENAPVVRKARREDLEWRIRRGQKRMAEVEARAAAITTEP